MWRFRIFSVLLLSGFHLAAPKSSLRYPNSQPDPTACQCVPRQDCLNGDFDLQNTCQNYSDVCCAPVSISNAKRQPRSSNHSDIGQRNYENMDNPETPTRANDVVLRKCGLRNPEGVDPSDVIQRTDEAKFGEFPWMAELLFKNHTDKQGKVVLLYHGGASLIHPKAVITAAHCVLLLAPNRIVVRAGEWDQRNENEYLPHRDRDVRKVIIHEGYQNDRILTINDYALVILKSPFMLTQHIGLACLPGKLNAFDPSRCVATGWGKKVFDLGTNVPKILKKVTLPLVPRDACENTYNISGLSGSGPLHASVFCAGGEEGKDTCEGDSGGPLVCPILDDPTRYVQVGIVARGLSYCGLWIPGQYSNVTLAREWILQKLMENGVYIYDSTTVMQSP